MTANAADLTVGQCRSGSNVLYSRFTHCPGPRYECLKSRATNSLNAVAKTDMPARVYFCCCWWWLTHRDLRHGHLTAAPQEHKDLFSEMYAGHDCWTQCCKCPSSACARSSCPVTVAMHCCSSDALLRQWCLCVCVCVCVCMCVLTAVTGELWPHIERWILTDWKQPGEQARQDGDQSHEAVAPPEERCRVLARRWDAKLNVSHRERMQAAAQELSNAAVPKVDTS